jgi:hypothetical protein
MNISSINKDNDHLLSTRTMIIFSINKDNEHLLYQQGQWTSPLSTRTMIISSQQGQWSSPLSTRTMIISSIKYWFMKPVNTVVLTFFNCHCNIMVNLSEWLLLKANSAIFQPYHDENKLIFSEMMMRTSLY